MDARHLARALADPAYAAGLDARGWQALLAMADAEGLTASLARRLDGLAIPADVALRLEAARDAAEARRGDLLGRVRALATRATALDGPVLLANEAAYVAAGMEAGCGRHVDDVLVLVPPASVEKAKAAIGGEAIVKADDAGLLSNARALENGLWFPAPDAMLIRAVAGLLASGDLTGGLAMLWGIDRLIREFSGEEGFWQRAHAASSAQALTPLLSRALRLSHHLFGTPVDPWLAWEARQGDVFYLGRLLARDREGRETRPILRLAFRVRARLLRGAS